MLVKDIKSGSTAQVLGVSLQLFASLNELVPNALVSFEDLIATGSIIKGDDGLVPFCQPSVKAALARFIKSHPHLKPIANNCWRSLAAQFVLKHQQELGLIPNFVANVGHSNHGSGTALDFNNWQDLIAPLQDQGWIYPYGANDDMHLEWRQGVKDLRQEMIKSFQSLHNLANPDQPITVDGIMGPATLRAIGESPAEGFYNIKYPRILKLTSPYQQGKDVGELQIALRNQGITVKADCIFEVTTFAGVKTFQIARKLPPTGVVDAQLRTLLGLKWVGGSEQFKGELVTAIVRSDAEGKEQKALPASLLPGVDLIKKFEGFYANAYTDPRTGGEPITIGYGCTVKPDGGKWKIGDTITEPEADKLLSLQLATQYLPSLEKIPVWGELNRNQQSALLSFGYNLGADFFGKPGFESITNVLKNKNWDLIPETFIKYRNPGSCVEAGLRKRREAEAQLFLSPT